MDFSIFDLLHHRVSVQFIGANVRVLLHRFKLGLHRFAVGIGILTYGQSVYMIPAGAPWMLCRDPLA